MLGYVQTESEVRADYIGLSKQLKRLMAPRRETLPSACNWPLCPLRSPFDSKLESFQCVIPLGGNYFQRAPRLLQLAGFEFPQPLPSNLHIARQPGAGKHSQMLGNSLPRQVGPGSELRDRLGSSHTQS